MRGGPQNSTAAPIPNHRTPIFSRFDLKLNFFFVGVLDLGITRWIRTPTA
jgi:hypothetical protein